MKSREELEDNKILKDWSFADNGVKKSGDFPEQVDLLLQIGSMSSSSEKSNVSCFRQRIDRALQLYKTHRFCGKTGYSKGGAC